MTDNLQDPWRTRALEEFGAQLGALERRAPRRGRQRQRARLALAATAGCAAVAVTCGLLLAGGGAAQASTAVNRAPKAAASAGSVLYTAATTIEEHGQVVVRLVETGAVDFGNGSYTATLSRPGDRDRIQRRSIDGTLYVGAGVGRGQPGRWLAIALPAAGLSGSTAPAGSQALTDPPALLHAMSVSAARPRVVGSAVIDGVATIEYHVSTRLAAFLPETRLPPAVGRQPADLSVWVDHAGRPRRAAVTFTSPSDAARLTTLSDFSGYGTAVRVTAPVANVIRAPIGADAPDPIEGNLSELFLPRLAAGARVTPAVALPAG